VEFGLVSDPNTNFLVAELPVWVGNVISGHIDLVEKVGETWWIWDYKSDDVKSLPSYAQVWLYRKMFAYRLGLKEEEIRMGYFNRECEVEVEEVETK
jgi:ATP-dependent exoDNAse (exonuclease V) beta subunit